MNGDSMLAHSLVWLGDCTDNEMSTVCVCVAAASVIGWPV